VIDRERLLDAPCLCALQVAALMMGVGGGTEDKHTLLLSGVAGLVGGALSMAVGEYISVSSQVWPVLL
jgi:VIT1/CCC1 family predicted Fe2+/Mn2+ transporter